MPARTKPCAYRLAERASQPRPRLSKSGRCGKLCAGLHRGNNYGPDGFHQAELFGRWVLCWRVPKPPPGQTPGGVLV